MNNKQFLENVQAIIQMLLKNAAHSFGIDFALVSDTAIECEKRLKSEVNNDNKQRT